MLGAEELAEMRALQVRAYGRVGELSREEADRLAELQAHVPEPREAVRPGPLEPVGAERAPVPTNEAHGSPSFEARLTAADTALSPAEQAEATGDSAGVDRSSPTASALSAVRALARPLAVAAVAVLALGVGIGWLVFGRADVSSVALTPEQQEWQTALLSEGVYDSGSVRAVAVEEGIVIWLATQDERDKTCLILSDGERTRPSCQATDLAEEEGIWGSLAVEIGEDVRREVTASVLFAPSGEPAVRVDSWDQTPGTANITYASEKETRIAAALAADGFDPNSIWVAGYDGDVPVWTATETDSQAQCLIYDGAGESSPRVCADPQTMTDQESGLVLNVVDPVSGDSTTFEMSQNSGPSYLVITRERGETGAGGD